VNPARGQNEFDFDRGERLALLDALQVPSGKTKDGKASVQVSGATALSVLRAIEAHGRHTGQCWASSVTIAREIGRSDRTVRRAIHYLEQLQFLLVDRSPGKSMRCRMDWGEISLKARGTPSPDHGHSLVDPGQFDTNPGQFDTNPGQCVRRSVRSVKEASTPPSPSSFGTPDDCTAVSVAPPASWSEVEAALCGLLGDWRRALRDVRQSGVDPRHVLQIIDHYRSLGDRVGPGALYWRLRNAHPTLKPQDGWVVSQVAPQSPRPVRESSSQVYSRVVREGRRKGASDQQIRDVLAKALVRAGFDPDTEVYR
jgi:hypothetical protein